MHCAFITQLATSWHASWHVSGLIRKILVAAEAMHHRKCPIPHAPAFAGGY